MQQINLPPPIYIFISPGTLSISYSHGSWSFPAASSREIYEKLSEALTKIAGKYSVPFPELILESNIMHLVRQFNNSSHLTDIMDVKAYINAKDICKKFNCCHIEYKEISTPPELCQRELRVQTIKEMLDRNANESGAIITIDDFRYFPCIDIANGKSLTVIRIDINCPIAKCYIKKGQTIFDLPSNQPFTIKPEDPTVYCKYEEPSKEYGFPPGRIGVIAPFENIMLTI
jgi:hypothetical protein